MEKLIDFLIGKSQTLSLEQESLLKQIKGKAFRQGEIIQQKGDPNTKVYFVKKGLLKSYVLDQSGKEHIYMFAPEGWLISDLDSKSGDQTSVLYIDAIEDSEVEVLDKSVLKDLIRVFPESNLNRAEMLANRIAVLQERVIMLMSATALQRYEHFLSTYPQITQRIPQRMIASYLGITPEALSKIRGKRAKK
ncbi:Crp/Fnr family transcriptional regulator [Pararhodonellum marinum]|uniref:Crp/Fnr family transcriptional regulator n=1 Tax=Pararhodonellum marinum TaxID=2755358 RepID=UPI00188EFB6D|nr:Crp/Fnr family transcriptional regulator [Pararhodonellum marinum]